MIAGTINQNNNIISFVADEFSFTFINNNFVQPIDFANYSELEPDENGYIWGTTHEGKGIAIFIKKRLEVKNVKTLDTWNYIVFNNRSFNNSDIGEIKCGINAIKFVNGSVQSISSRCALQEDFEEEINYKEKYNKIRFIYEPIEDSKEFFTNINNEKVRWYFGSEIKQKNSIEEGNSLENTTSYLCVKFEKDKDLKAFYDYYGYVTALIAFLTFRKNIIFEKIELLSGNKTTLSKIGQCYVRSSYNEINSSNDRSNSLTLEKNGGNIRSFMNVLSVRELSDESFSRIVNCVIKPQEESTLPLVVVPKDKNDFFVNEDRIRLICSALEVEINAAGIVVSKEKDMQELKSEVKSIVKSFRSDANRSISGKAYDVIFNSISYWGDAIADRALKAWKMNRELIERFLLINSIRIEDDDIIRFVKARNDITHRGFHEIDDSLASTSFALIGLIYAMAMIRMEVKKDVIIDLMGRNFIS